MQLENFDIELFLRDYWQQKPLLIKNPWQEWINPLDPDELAGLACEEEVESRLVIQQRPQWKVEHGPIPEARFATLPKAEWTLLVQAVDHFVPDVADLLDAFRFIPNWRIDDVMVSYAAENGGVGAHFDQYDVFLIQGLGTRRWQIGALCDETTPLLPHDELRLLARFKATEEWLLEPGDILYLPPRYAHNGVAVSEDCMTYSVGFRAPARGDLVANFCDYVLGTLTDDDRYSDPGLAAAKNSGEISAEALKNLQQMVADKLLDADSFRSWFGCYSTSRKYVDDDIKPEKALTTSQLLKHLQRGEILLRNPTSRFAFVRDDDRIQLFVDGEPQNFAPALNNFVETLCANTIVATDTDLLNSSATIELLTALFNQGSLVFADDD
ncbi:MAG: cupin protein [Verrucomicrobiaceae bacterium]|nr:cupin protein [Verrucomicrobiaceae bacterium]